MEHCTDLGTHLRPIANPLDLRNCQTSACGSVCRKWRVSANTSGRWVVLVFGAVLVQAQDEEQEDQARGVEQEREKGGDHRAQAGAAERGGSQSARRERREGCCNPTARRSLGNAPRWLLWGSSLLTLG